MVVGEVHILVVFDRRQWYFVRARWLIFGGSMVDAEAGKTSPEVLRVVGIEYQARENV